MTGAAHVNQRGTRNLLGVIHNQTGATVLVVRATVTWLRRDMKAINACDEDEDDQPSC
jgi:hypothetical protein